MVAESEMKIRRIEFGSEKHNQLISITPCTEVKSHKRWVEMPREGGLEGEERVKVRQEIFSEKHFQSVALLGNE
jgi:hypothetical protein